MEDLPANHPLYGSEQSKSGFGICYQFAIKCPVSASKTQCFQGFAGFVSYSHSIVAGCPHADGILSQLNYYLRKGFDLVLTSHYTPEDLKDVRTKIAYLMELKEIALDSESADEMRAKVQAKYPHYSGQNYLDMTVGFFFPQK